MENLIEKVMTATEADIYFDLPKGTTKRDCLRGMFPEGTTRKAAHLWLIEKEALIQRYEHVYRRIKKIENHHMEG